MARVSELRGIIYSKYDSESQFAKELGWNRQRLNKITNGIKEPDLEEVAAIANKLDRTTDEIFHIFLRHKSPNGQQANGGGWLT